MKTDFFGDGMKIFLDYICRQSKKNKHYKPHSLIRAFECALQGIDKLQAGQRTIGLSGDGTPRNTVYNPYVVVIEKGNNGIVVKEIRNIQIDKEIPLDILLITFRIQIHLDRIEGETVNPQQMVDILNATIPTLKFYALGDRWMEARDNFIKLVEEGKTHKPDDPKLISELLKITKQTPWEDYSNTLRAFIGSYIAPSIEERDGLVVITSPKNSKIEKYKVFDNAIEMLLGKSSEHFKNNSNK